MDYSERLKYFNSTDKYRKELTFVFGLLTPEYGSLLDYGCGIGTAIHYFNDSRKEHGSRATVKGYDIRAYFKERPYWLIDEVTGTFDNITFIHSIAHVANIRDVLTSLRDNLNKGGRITAITPNKNWIDEVGDTKSDPTVIEHFTGERLWRLFTSCGYKIIQQGQYGDLVNGQNERIFIQVEK